MTKHPLPKQIIHDYSLHNQVSSANTNRQWLAVQPHTISFKDRSYKGAVQFQQFLGGEVSYALDFPYHMKGSGSFLLHDL